MQSKNVDNTANVIETEPEYDFKFLVWTQPDSPGPNGLRSVIHILGCTSLFWGIQNSLLLLELFFLSILTGTKRLKDKGAEDEFFERWDLFYPSIFKHMKEWKTSTLCKKQNPNKKAELQTKHQLKNLTQQMDEEREKYILADQTIWNNRPGTTETTIQTSYKEMPFPPCLDQELGLVYLLGLCF